MPVFVREGKEQLPKMGPVISRRLRRQAEKISAELRDDVRIRLNGTAQRTVEQIVERIFESYPGLKSVEEKRRLEAYVRERLNDSVTIAITGFQDRFAGDIEELKTTLLNAPETDLPAEDLYKKFFRLCLQLLDERISKL